MYSFAYINEASEVSEYNDRHSRTGPAPSTPWENLIKEHLDVVSPTKDAPVNYVNNNNDDRSSANAKPSTEWENKAKEYNVSINSSVNNYTVKPKCTYNSQGQIVCPK